MSESLPKILAVAGPCPFAPSHGAQLRVKNILDLLQRCGKVSLALVSMGQHAPEALRKTAEAYDLKGNFRLEHWPLGACGRILRESSPRYLNTHGFRMKPEDQAALLKLARTCDLVWFHSVRLPNAAGIEWISPSVLDADDLLSRYHASAAKHTGPIKQLLELKRCWQWRRREKLFLDRFDGLVICSEGDRNYLGRAERMHVVPNGFEKIERHTEPARNGTPTIGFVGSLRYPANRDGVKWFLEKVWPLIRQKQPNARLRLVGEDSKDLAADAGPNVEGAGWVDDLRTEMADWWLTVVPVHVGGGTRVKIATSFSCFCPVVSTTWGAYGYEVENGREILLADEPADFAGACCRLLEDDIFAGRVARAAAEAFEKNWTWEAIAPRVSQAVTQAWQHGRDRNAGKPGVAFRLRSLN